MKKNDVAKMRQAGTAPAAGVTIYCPISLWCTVIYKRCAAMDTTNTFKYLGLIKDFNRLDVAQHSDTIKLSCKKHIDRVLTTHGWSKPSLPVPSKPSAPLPVDTVTSICAHQPPPENTAKHAALVAKCGFAYRTLLGKLLCAYVTCRPDIGYATIALSKFSTCPHAPLRLANEAGG